MRDHCCSGKTESVTYSERAIVALGIQHLVRMRSIILSSVACLGPPYFHTLSRKLHDFRKKEVFAHKMCVLNLSTTFVCNLDNSKKNSARYDHKCT